MRICISNFNLFFYTKKCFFNLLFPRFLLSKWKYLSIWNSNNHCIANIVALLKSNMVSISFQTVEKQHHQIHTNKIMFNKNSFLPCNQRKMCKFIQVLLGSCRIYVWFTMFSPQNKKRLRKTKTSQENLNSLHFSSAAPWECIFHS